MEKQKPLEIYKPAIPFRELIPEVKVDKAMRVVQNMSEDQVRYALWAAIVLLYGDPSCNAAEKTVGSRCNNKMQDMMKAHLILAQVGVGEHAKPYIDAIKEEYGL